MASRALEIVLTLALTLVFGGIVLWATGAVPAEAVLTRTPALLVAGLWIGIPVWIVLLVITAIRDRARGRQRRSGNNVACATIAAVVNVVVLTIIGFSLGGYSIFLSLMGAIASVVFVVSAALASLIARLVVKGRTQRIPQPETPAGT